MAKLVYSMICSLDGMVEDADGDFSWAEPGPELMAFINDDNAGIRTELYGRRLWETMRYWETAPTGAETDPGEIEWTRIWRAARKHVYSRTLAAVDTSNTTLHSEFRADDVRAIVDAADTDVTIGGAGLAMAGFAAGVIDEVRLVTLPIIVGRGKSIFPEHRVDLELLEQHAIGATGAVAGRWRVRR